MNHATSITESIFWRIHTVLNETKNAMGYPLRRLIRWRRGIPHFSNEPKNNIFAHLPPEKQREAHDIEEHLRRTYHLELLKSHSTADNYRLNLFYLEMLERAFSDASVNLTSSIETADIGPSDWFYVQGLHACLTWWATSSPRNLQLTGYETDAFRIYGDFFSRCDHAYAHMDGLEKVIYVPEPFSTQPNHFDAIFLFFPFIFLKDHIIWGLPKGSFDPEELLKSVLVSLKNSGILFIVNQGEAEHEAQKAILLKHGITPIISFKHGSLIHQYKIPRYVLLALKE